MIIGAPVGFFGSAAAAARTWNPSVKDTEITLSNGNKTASIGVLGYNWRIVLGSDGRSSGKKYFEIYCEAAGSDMVMVGVSNSTVTIGGSNTYVGKDANSWGWRAQGEKVHSASFTAFGSAFTTGDNLGVAVDFSAGYVWFAKNNTWQASGDPGAGTNPAFTGLSGTLYPVTSIEQGGSVTLLSTLTYSPPSGFSAW